MAKNYAMTAIRRSLVEAHLSVTPGQDRSGRSLGNWVNKENQPRRLTSISDAHSQHGPTQPHRTTHPL